MSNEVYANNFATMLADAVAVDDETITTLSAAPAELQDGQFRIVIDDEYMIVTDGQDSTTWDVTRGAEGSTATTHAAGVSVFHYLTAGGLENVPVGLNQLPSPSMQPGVVGGLAQLTADAVTDAPTLPTAQIPTELGLPPSGDTTGATDLANLTSALEGGSVTLTPGATYYINAPLVIPKNAVLRAQQCTITLTDAFTGGNTPITVVAGARVRELRVNGAAATGYGVNNPAVLCLDNSHFIDGTVTDFPGAGIGASGPGVTIRGNTITDCTDQGILMNAGASQSRIADNTIDGCLHGIQWWGGDTAPEYGISDLTITGNVITNCVDAAIWGADGESITVTGNVCDTGGDVGIDFESCANCTATGNTVTNFTNGALTIFYGSSNITFSGNTVVQTGAQDGIYLHGGGTGTGNVISGNTINVTTGVGIYTDDTAATYVNITGNTVTTTTGIPILLNYADSTHIIGNILRITTSGPTGIQNSGGNGLTIANNRITTASDTSDTDAVSGGIHNYWSSADNPATQVRMTGNLIDGFVKSIYEDNWGGTSPGNIIADNTVANIYINGNGGAYAGNVYNNYNVGGAAVSAIVGV